MVVHLLGRTSGSITLLGRRENSLLLKTSALQTHSNQLYMDGDQHHVGTKLVASLMRHFPEYLHAGTRRLPRPARVLKGWRNLSPGESNKA